MVQKNKVLKLLADGRFHSGEELGAALGVTRSAVWKKMKQIEQLYGIELQAVRGRGYAMVEPIELLDAAVIRGYLKPEVSNSLQALEVFDSIPSTHDYLQQADGLESASVCLAEHQSSGRGRRGRTWVSPFGCNLYLSVFWRFQQGPAGLSGLSLAAAVAAAQALQAFGIHDGIGLKWPNDIYWQNKKLGGILLDVVGEANGESHVVLSVGVNLNLPKATFAEIEQPCVDVTTITGQVPSRNQIAGLLVNRLIQMLQAFPTTGFAGLKPAWQQFDIVTGKTVDMHLDDKIVTGIAKGVNEHGELLLDIQGELKRFLSGDVSLRVKST